jgi:hypothetical protein
MALRADIGWRDQGAGWTASVVERRDLVWLDRRRLTVILTPSSLAQRR